MKKFSFNELEKDENGILYEVEVVLPMSMGWYDDVNFVVGYKNNMRNIPLKHYKNEDGNVYFRGQVYLDTKAIYHYYFSYLIDGSRRGYLLDDDNEKFKMSVNFDVPDWAKGKMMYHIFVDRFYRGSKEKMEEMPRRMVHEFWDEDVVIGPDKDGIWNNDFFGGDLKGITEKLDYIQSLGVSILYLSPVCWSQSNHRYDASDYENIDPYAGCNLDLKVLCDEAHKRGMKVVLDGVFNHTGNDSKYFNEYGNFDNEGAYNNPSSKYASFYKKRFHNGKAYYSYWWDFKTLPVCDGESTYWQDYIYGEDGVIDKWFDLGIDGLRLDVADELTDKFIEGIRRAVKRNKEDGFILGEVWKNPMRMGRSYIESGKGMDSVMNYSLIDALIRYFKYGDVEKLSYIIKDIQREYPEETIQSLMNFTSTHDISRIINIFGSDKFNYHGEWVWNLVNDSHEFCKTFRLNEEEYERGKAVYQAYAFALAFMPGIFSIFYGDEVGMQGMGNLKNRGTFPWGKEDLELLEFFRQIGSYRSKEEFLEKARFKVVDVNKRYFMFERKLGEEKALVTVNRTDKEQDFIVPSEYEGGKVYSLKRSIPGMLSPYGGICIKKES